MQGNDGEAEGLWKRREETVSNGRNDGRVVVIMAEEGGDDVKWRKRWQSSGNYGRGGGRCQMEEMMAE